MPMVPTSFVPTVDQQAGQPPRQSGPFVQPAENYAPRLQQQMGATTEQSGLGLMREGETIGMRIQDQLNDTAVKNAETQLLGTIQNTLHGPDGYLNQRGQNAVTGYDNAAQAIAKAKQDAEGTLTNDFQKRLFGPMADRHLITFGAEMNDHRFQQVASVGAKSATDRVDAHIPFAVNARNAWQQTDADGNPTGVFQAHLGVIQQEASHAAGLMYGVGPNSDIAQNAVRQATTEVARGVVNGFLQDHAYKEAKTFFDNWNGQGKIDEKTAEVLGNAIKEVGDREFTETTAESAALKAMGAGNGDAGKPSFLYPVTGGSITQQYGVPEKTGQPHNGIDIAVPAGTKVMAPGPGSVLKVWDDDENGGGRSMLVKLDNGYTAGFAHLSATNYNPGDQVTQGQPIALTGNSGWNTTGAHLHYTLTDPDGNKVDPANANQATPQQKIADLNNFTDPKALQSAIEDVRTNVADPVLQKQTVNYLESLQRKARVQQEEIAQQNYKMAQDQFFGAGGDYTKIAPEQWANLTQQQKYLFKKGLPRETDTDTQASFILNDVNQTVQWVQQHRMDFSNEQYLTNLSHAKSMDDARADAAGGNPTKLIAGKDFSQQIENTLLQGGLGHLVGAKPGSADQVEKAQIYNAIYNRQDALEQTQKRPLTRTENQQVIDSVLNDKVMVDQLSNPLLPRNHAFSLWGLNPGALLLPMRRDLDPTELTAAVPAGDQRATYVNYMGHKVYTADVPEKYREYVVDDLQKSGLSPTEFDIAARWVDDGMPGGTHIAAARSRVGARLLNNR